MKDRPLQFRRIFQKRLTRSLVICGAVIALLTLAGVAAVSTQTHPLGQSKQASAVMTQKSYVTVRVAGQNVQVDSQTGQIKPLTPDEAQKLAQGLKELVNQSSEGLSEVRHANGAVSVDLQGRFQSLAVAKKDAQGIVSQSCVDNPKSAAVFFEIDPTLLEGGTKSPTQTSPRMATATVNRSKQKSEVQ